LRVSAGVCAYVDPAASHIPVPCRGAHMCWVAACVPTINMYPLIMVHVRAQFFGIKGFGFTKENELFVGRVAQLGFAAALIGEAVTGVGPLAQLGELFLH